MPKICRVEGCTKPVKGYGYCLSHYRRYKRYGDPMQCQINKTGLAKKYKREHSAYTTMKARCYNQNVHEYSNYGGRGIKVCDRWLGPYGFQHFLEDMGPRPERHTLDRIDCNKDYCPDNCRWATYLQQNNNRRNNKVITYNEESHTVAEWERKMEFNRGTLQRRIRDGWDTERALITPSRGSYFLGKSRK